jgi:hypothetical protein
VEEARVRTSTSDRVRDQAARAEAWRRRALAQEERADVAESEALLADVAGGLGPCSSCETMREEIRLLEREGREAARDAFGEGYARAREEDAGW